MPITDLPHALLYIIFSKLGFKDKINAGKVCKDWDKLLKAGSPGCRLWDVEYHTDTVLSRPAYRAPENGFVPDDLMIDIVRYGTVLEFSITLPETYRCLSQSVAYVKAAQYRGPAEGMDFMLLDVGCVHGGHCVRLWMLLKCITAWQWGNRGELLVNGYVLEGLRISSS
jgi:hypothetical protein